MDKAPLTPSGQDGDDRRGGEDRADNEPSSALTSFVPLVLVAGFLGGIVTALAGTFPSSYVDAAYRSGMALYDKMTNYRDVYGTDLWRDVRTDAVGAALCLPDRAQPGYTLFTTGDGPRALLVDLDGTVVHEWRRPFSDFWDETSPVREPQPDSHIYMRKAQVMPNGDLLAIYIAAGDTPWGYGMAKLDRDSQVIWRYLEQTHHDFDIAADGRIFTLTHDLSDRELPEAHADIATPRVEDYLVILSPDGEELAKISLLDALMDSPYSRLLYQMAAYTLDDPLHTNAVELIDADKARAFPFGEEGQVLLSFRELGAIAVLDVETQKVTWATRGPWVGQHDPDILPDGNILLFDNIGRFGNDDRSRVIEFDPRTLAIRWQYPADGEGGLDSVLRSAQERLPNGNTLITESDGGRILEVTPEGDLAWVYVNEVRGGPDGRYIPVISWAQRVLPDSMDTEFRGALSVRPAGAGAPLDGGADASTPDCGSTIDGAV